MSPKALASLDRLRAGGKPALAGALALVEGSADDPAVLALLGEAYGAPRAQVIGVTGPPGVGKSTLIAALIGAWRARGATLGVIAVDPSSRLSGGALLGDRIRLATNPDDSGLFIRSMAARERLGGLADATVGAMVLMRALYDRVIVETVGVGQSETDVAGVVDTVVFCVQPGSGDALQFMKAGILEIPHIAVVTKADQGAAAGRALADLKGALASSAGSQGWPLAVLSLSAIEGRGIDDLEQALARHWDYLGGQGRLEQARRAQAEAWLKDALRSRFGSDGLRRAGAITLGPEDNPFARLARLTEELTG